MQNRNLHPFLFAAFPALALLAHNLEEIKVFPVIRPLALSLIAAALLYLLLSRLLRSPVKAALLTTLTLAMFFSYGQVYALLKPLATAGVALGRHRLLAPLWLALFTAAAVWIFRRKSIHASVTQALNLFGLVLVIFPLAQAASYGLRAWRTAESTPQATAGLGLPQSPPDIYYIILDAYARDDILRDDYGLDTTPFLDELEAMGFVVTRCSQSNYAQTQLSLASSLNMNYLSELGEFDPGSADRLGISELIHHGAVRGALEELGYKSVAFETGFKGTQWEDADLYLSPNEARLSAGISGGMTAFEEMLLRTSLGLLLIDSRSALPQALRPGFNHPNQVRRELILNDLEQLGKLPGMHSPKLVFAHLVNPHPPYVFEADGEFVDYDKPDDPGYQDQIRYLNQVLPPLLRKIIEQSPTPPVIILQGDHGAIHAPPNKRMAIFNAYYLPGVNHEQIPADISPVNTFRLVFNHYFQGKFALLENTANFSVYNRPYEYTVVPNRRNCR